MEKSAVVCSEERTSHTAPPPPTAVRLQAVKALFHYRFGQNFGEML